MHTVRKKKLTNPAVEAVLESDDDDEEESGLQMIEEDDDYNASQEKQTSARPQRSGVAKKNFADELIESDEDTVI
jgi:hypothetical protein